MDKQTEKIATIRHKLKGLRNSILILFDDLRNGAGTDEALSSEMVELVDKSFKDLIEQLRPEILIEQDNGITDSEQKITVDATIKPGIKQAPYYLQGINLSNIKGLFILDSQNSINSNTSLKKIMDSESYGLEVQTFESMFMLKAYLGKLGSSFDPSNSYFIISVPEREELSRTCHFLNSLNLQSNALLIPSEQCSLNDRDYDKIMAQEIYVTPIENWSSLQFFYTNTNKNVVVIDDDELIHSVWKKKFKQAGVESTNFFYKWDDFRDFQDQDGQSDLAKDTLFIIDLEFANDPNRSGTQICEMLFAQGFRNIYLVTGRDYHLINVNDTIKQIRYKKFPMDLLD